MDPSTTTLTNRCLIEKQQQQQQQLPPLKCPRCDSMNTKFCYYNNYSLSQPRHFCKACKRYWTRGGTLRNVPVGGGCRKNKRVRRSNADGSTSSSSNITTTTTQNPNPQILSSQAHANTSNHMSSLFYSPMSNLSNLGLANPSNHSLSHGFGLSSLGLGIGSIGGGENNGFMNSNSSSSLLSSYNPMFGSTTTTTTTPTPTMASLLPPSLYQNKNNNNNGGIGILNVQGQNLDFHSSSLQDLEIRGHNINNNNNNNNEMKNVEGVGKMDQHHHWNQMEQIGLSDPSFYSWSGNNGSSVWHDPTNNIGSSLTSLI